VIYRRDNSPQGKSAQYNSTTQIKIKDRENSRFITVAIHRKNYSGYSAGAIDRWGDSP
jgi:hypothetical protein